MLKGFDTVNVNVEEIQYCVARSPVMKFEDNIRQDIQMVVKQLYSLTEMVKVYRKIHVLEF